MGDPRWLEVSVVVDREMADPVSDVLGRFVSNGVVVESGVTYNDAEDEGTQVGPVRVYGYIAIDEHLEETRQRLLEAFWYLGRIRPLPEPSFKTIEDEDWMASWKQHYKPIPIGQRLIILPIWIDPQTTKRIPVRIDPSMAFGTGTHPTTQLCLELEETYVQPGQTVIDVGCGSGILSIAAIKLGAVKALAVDIDNASVRSTKENAEANGVAAEIETGLGSVDEVRQGQFSVRQAPLVLANILAPVIVRLFDAGMAELIAPSGRIILSGILAEQGPMVVEAAAKQGLKFIQKLQMGDWIALVMER